MILVWLFVALTTWALRQARELPILGEEPALVRAEDDDERMWSVTTLIGALDKPALVHWAAIETAKAAIDSEKAWRSRLENEGRDAAIDYLKGARFRRPRGQRSAADLGKAVHAACEHKAIYGAFRPEDAADDEMRPMLTQFDRFLDEWQPEYIAAEVTVFSPTFGYAGTCDGFFRLQGTPLIFDYKTSRETYDSRDQLKGPYPEVGLQLAGYRYAELAAVWRARQTEVYKRRYYLLSDTERALGVPVPEVDGGVVVYLTPEHYAVHPIRCDESVYEQFLYVIEAARFAFETAKTVIGAPMIPPAAFAPTDAGDPFAGLPA